MFRISTWTQGITTCRELHRETQSLDDPEMNHNVRVSKSIKKEINGHMSKGMKKQIYAMSNTRPPLLRPLFFSARAESKGKLVIHNGTSVAEPL